MKGFIPCITVWQPWASLIAVGAKPYEFRSWAAPRDVRGRRIAIHAAIRPPRTEEIRALIQHLETGVTPETELHAGLALPLLRDALMMPASLVTSAVVCTAMLGEPIRATSLGREADRDMWAWPITDIEPVAPPFPARGRQGFWWVRIPAGPDEAKP